MHQPVAQHPGQREADRAELPLGRVRLEGLRELERPRLELRLQEALVAAARVLAERLSKEGSDAGRLRAIIAQVVALNT